MPSLSPKTRLSLSIACGLVFVTLLASLSLRSAQGFAKSSRDVAWVHDAIEVIDQTQDALTAADNLQHLVLEHRAPMRQFNLSLERRRFTERIAALDVAVSSFPGAHPHVDRLAGFGYQRLSNDAKILSTFSASGADAAMAVSRSGNSLEAMSGIETEIGFLRQILLQRLKRVAAESESNQEESRYWLEAGLILVALAAAIAGVSSFRDAGRRIDVEENLQTVAALQKAILDSVGTSIIATDQYGTITVFNPASETMLGYSAEEMVGKCDPGQFHDRAEVIERAKALSESTGQTVNPGFELLVWRARNGITEPEEWTFVKKDGTSFPALLTISLLKDTEGQVVGYVGISYDLTERNRTQAILDDYVKEIEAANVLAQQQNRELMRTAEELKESRDAAVAATRMKSEFLANMSHEIRTPMNGVIGMTHLLLSTPMTEKQIAYARTVQQSAESLLSILNDILDLSKMEAGKMTLENFPFELRNLLEDLCEVLAPTAHAKGLELNCVIPPSAPSHVIGDPGRLRQVLMNLMGNGIKFTERGEVSVSVKVLKENQKRVTFRFSVADTGIGISRDRQDRIFDSFTQGDGSTTRKFGGTGLGLTISRQLAELMGGEIGVTSSPGAGSEFWVELAFQKQPSVVADQPLVRQDLAGIRVLVADDNATNRYFLREILGSWNCRLTEVANGTEALSAISLSASDPFACVILDMNMPEMDGIEAARAIKRDPRHKDVPLILLTSSGFAPTDVASASLYAAVLTKPVRTSPLFNVMSLVTGTSHRTESRPFEAEMASLEPLKGVRVLVVEDNAINQLVVSQLLESWGCTVVQAENGKIGVEANAREKFDVILMDVQMPVMDGLEATALIRAQEEETGSHTDIIAMTANAMSGDRERCLRAGMDSYMSKPLQPSILLEKLSKSTGRLMIGSETTAVSPSPSTGSFDFARLDESCSGSSAMKLKVIDRYFSTSLDSLAQISQAVARGDANAAKSAAHALKGSSLTIGASKVGEICQVLETAAASAELGPEQLPFAEALSVELLAVHAVLKAYVQKLSQT